MALLSFRWIQHPEPTGSRRATPTHIFNSGRDRSRHRHRCLDSLKRSTLLDQCHTRLGTRCSLLHKDRHSMSTSVIRKARHGNGRSNENAGCSDRTSPKAPTCRLYSQIAHLNKVARQLIRTATQRPWVPLPVFGGDLKHRQRDSTLMLRRPVRRVKTEIGLLSAVS